MIYEPRSLCCASVCLYDMGFIMIARGLWWAKRVRAANFASRSHGNNTMCSAANLRVWTMKLKRIRIWNVEGVVVGAERSSAVDR